MGKIELYSQEKIKQTELGNDPLLYPNIDWYNELFTNYTYNQKAHFNIRGGNNRLIYFMGITVNHDTGMLKTPKQKFASYKSKLDIWNYSFQNNISVNLSSSVSLLKSASLIIYV